MCCRILRKAVLTVISEITLLFTIVSSKWEILEVVIAGVYAESVHLSQLYLASVSLSP